MSEKIITSFLACLFVFTLSFGYAQASRNGSSDSYGYQRSNADNYDNRDNYNRNNDYYDGRTEDYDYRNNYRGNDYNYDYRDGQTMNRAAYYDYNYGQSANYSYSGCNCNCPYLRSYSYNTAPGATNYTMPVVTRYVYQNQNCYTNYNGSSNCYSGTYNDNYRYNSY